MRARGDEAHMIHFGFEQSGSIGLLTFDGALTTQHSGEMKTALMRALHRVDHLVCNLEKVTAIDIACFRLICMAQRISSRLGKRLTVTGVRHKSFKRLFEDNRFKHKECFLDCLKVVCRWKHTERPSAKETAAAPEGGLADGDRKVPAAQQAGAENRYESTLRREKEVAYEH